MPRGVRATVLMAAACVLAAVIAAGCASGPPRTVSTGVGYTCCEQSVVATRWHPGQQLRLVWTRTGRPVPGQTPPAMLLTALLTGPFSSVSALKSAIVKGHRGALTAAAPTIRISRDPPRSPVSVIAIPANAPPGLYELDFSLSASGGSVKGGSIVSVG